MYNVKHPRIHLSKVIDYDVKKKTYTILVRHGILIGTKCGNIRKRERETANDQN